MNVCVCNIHINTYPELLCVCACAYVCVCVYTEYPIY